MDDGLIALGVLVLLGLVFGFFALPIAAWVRAGNVRAELKLLQNELDVVKAQLAGSAPMPVAIPVARAVIATPTSEQPLAPLEVRAPTPAPMPAVAASSLPVEAAAAIPVAGPLAPVAGTADAPSAPPPASSLEEKIALVWFTRIGAIALLLGVAYFFKFAVDNAWIGPWGRVALGAAAGAGILFFAELNDRKTKPVWTQVTLGIGLSFLLLSTYASHALYGLTPTLVAFGAFFIVTVCGGVLAVRHRGEAVLVFSLAAALAAPILLSTNQDNPLGLFGYLLVVTTLAYVTVLRMEFRWPLWLGVLGSGALWLGWYSKFFDNRPPPLEPLVDLPLAQQTGAYFPLAARIIPLVAVVAFCAQWIWVFIAARRKPRLMPLGLLVAATLFAHAGFAALLNDQPLILGGALVAIGLLSAYALSREGKPEYLALPLLVSFVVLVTTTPNTANGHQLAMVGMLGLWAATYGGAFLWKRMDALPRLSRRFLVLLGVVGAAFCILASILLGSDHPLAMVWIVVVLSLAYAALGVVARNTVVMVVAAGLSFAFLLFHMPLHGAHDLPFVAVGAAWALVYIGAVIWSWAVRKVTPTPLHVLVLSAAGLGFCITAVLHTGPDEGLLRALFLTAAGIVDLALGAWLLRQTQAMRQIASVLLGQALALFAGAAAFVFSGANLTLIWLALAAVVVVLASQEKDRRWLLGGLALFFLAAVWLVAVDFPEPRSMQALFQATEGRQGQLAPRFLFNPRAYALIAFAAMAWVAAAGAAKVALPLFKRSAVGLLAVGHLAFLTFLITELHSWALPHPVLPAGADSSVFEQFMLAYHEQVSQAEQQLLMLTTLAMGLYATGLVALGFSQRSRTHRYLGLALFAATLLKLGAWDVWTLPRSYQILVLIAVGALMLSASFLYARFGKRLVAMLRDGVTPALVLILALGAVRAQAWAPSDFAQRREITGVSAAGDYRVELDAQTYAHSRSALADLRLVGPDGKEVPFFVRALRAAPPPHLHPTTVVDPVSLPGAGAQAVLDLGQGGLKHSEVHLGIEGREFFRRTRLEISTDEKDWKLLDEGSVVYRAPSAANGAEETVVRYPVSDARYLRVTLLSGSDAEGLKILSAEVAYRTDVEAAPARALPLREVGANPRIAGQTSSWVFDLGMNGVPVRRLDLDIENPQFERAATVSSSNFETYWAPLQSDVLYRAATSRSGQVNASTGVDFSPSPKRYFQVQFTDADNAPLHVSHATVSYSPEELVFRVVTPGAYTLYAGSEKVSSALYDLKAVLERSGSPGTPSALLEAKLGPWMSNPGFETPEPEHEKAWTEQHATALGIALGVLVLGLALWTLRLMRNAPRPPEA